jgi:hypothetical protein
MKITKWNADDFVKKVQQTAANKLRDYGKETVSHIKTSMRETPRRTYNPIILPDGREHYPSLVYNYPAIMTGNLINALNYDVDFDGDDAVLRMGVFSGFGDSSDIGYAYLLHMDMPSGRRDYLNRGQAETNYRLKKIMGCR